MHALTRYAIVVVSLVAAASSLAVLGERRHNETIESATPAPAEAALVLRDIPVAAGTALSLVLDDNASSATSRADDPILARLAEPVVVNGVTVLPLESEVSGTVVSAVHATRVKGRALIAIRFDSVKPRGRAERYSIRTAAVSRAARGETKKDVLAVALPAAGGAILGGALGGGKGALIGAAAGGGAGTAYALSRTGPEVRFARGTRLSVKLLERLVVSVPVS